jgi:hypothetical protein
MFAVLAEDSSDADSLEVLVKRISGIQNQKVFKKGFNGCGELRKKSHRFVVQFSIWGAKRFIICHDSDGTNPATIRRSVMADLRKKFRGQLDLVIVVPVEELEAWIVADSEAVKRVIPSLSIRNVKDPESLHRPKEWLRDESARGRSTPLYIPRIHNAQVVHFIDLSKLEMKCPSFRPLKQFVSR